MPWVSPFLSQLYFGKNSPRKKMVKCLHLPLALASLLSVSAKCPHSVGVISFYRKMCGLFAKNWNRYTGGLLLICNGGSQWGRLAFMTLSFIQLKKKKKSPTKQIVKLLNTFLKGSITRTLIRKTTWKANENLDRKDELTLSSICNLRKCYFKKNLDVLNSYLSLNIKLLPKYEKVMRCEAHSHV